MALRDTFGIVVDVPADPTMLGAFVSRDSGYKRAAALFDEAKTDLAEILYNRRYSLLDEYGHRWVDLRRYGRLATLEKARPSHKIFPVGPIPVDECNQRSPLPKGCVNVQGF